MVLFFVSLGLFIAQSITFIFSIYFFFLSSSQWSVIHLRLNELFKKTTYNTTDYNNNKCSQKPALHAIFTFCQDFDHLQKVGQLLQTDVTKHQTVSTGTSTI